MHSMFPDQSLPPAASEIPRQQQPLPVVHNAYTPKEAIEISSRTGAYKAHMRIDKTIISSFMAGCLLSFGGACYSIINTSAWLNENAPGIPRMLGALIFPFGLVVIVMTGADLCTGSFMYTSLAALHRRTSVLLMLRHWFLTFFGNLAGALFVSCVIIGYGGVFEAAAYKKELLTIATTKAVTPMWHQIFLKAIGANWLVCLACFLACCAREFFSKVTAIWWPVFAFVLLGLDHVVANMFYIPLAIFYHHPDITVGYYIWKSMIPAALGNIVGGSVFVAFVYWYVRRGYGWLFDGHLYLFLVGDSSEIVIDGDYWDVQSRSSISSSSDPIPQHSSNKDDGKMV